MDQKFKSFETKAIRVGSDPNEINGSVIPAIFQTSTYVQPSPGKPKGFEYTRCSNPTRQSLEHCLSSLEESQYCIATASGLSSIACVMNLFKKGANIICGSDVYGGVYRLLETIFEDRYNVTWVDTTDINTFEEACKKVQKVDLVWLEAVSNPLLNVTDLVSICKVAKKYGAIVGVDSTFLTPYLQKPLKLGADIVVHSLTKYINGHSDAIAGAMFTNSKDLHDKLFHIQKTLGPSLSPFDSWLVLRGAKTLALRVKEHQNNAYKVAEFLNSHPKVSKVLYPGLSSHKNYSTLKDQCEKHFKGGGMVSFYLKGDTESVDRFLKALEVFQLAESLGGIESLVCIPALMTHASIPVDVRNKNGITNNLIRLSVGIEGEDDILSDLKNALEQA